MDFSRNLFQPWDAANDTFLGRNFEPLGVRSIQPLQLVDRNAMSTNTEAPRETASEETQVVQLSTAQLHAALRDVPLPVGFIERMRQLVERY